MYICVVEEKKEKKMFPRNSDFIFNLLEKMLNKQEEDVVNYMNESMTQTERNKHGENIWGYLLRAQGALAEIRLEMIADGCKIK